MDLAPQIQSRRAIEALRNGVPNRDAVRELGCSQPEIEERFRKQLQSLREGGENGERNNGMLIMGGFGTGKSHLLEYLMHLALEENFVCSKIVVSKETPLYDPVKFYRNAAELATVPGKRGPALNEIAVALDIESRTYANFYQWVQKNSSLDQRFAATLFLYEHMPRNLEFQDRIIRFWSGEKINKGEIKKRLKECGESVTYQMGNISAKELALQRFQFAARLIIAGGYSGWVLLIDEVELIGRYSLLQRAKSYVELARWMGRLEDVSYPGLTAVLAITDDFQSIVLEEKHDLEKVVAKVRARGSEADLLLASQAERGMRVIQREKLALVGPDDRAIERTHAKVKSIHAQAYSWDPPSVSTVERLATTRMRQFVRGWITEWDLKRFDPKYEPIIETTELGPGYGEDHDLEVKSEET